jgi:hypothetical protein
MSIQVHVPIERIPRDTYIVIRDMPHVWEGEFTLVPTVDEWFECQIARFTRDCGCSRVDMPYPDVSEFWRPSKGIVSVWMFRADDRPIASFTHSAASNTYDPLSDFGEYCNYGLVTGTNYQGVSNSNLPMVRFACAFLEYPINMREDDYITAVGYISRLFTRNLGVPPEEEVLFRHAMNAAKKPSRFYNEFLELRRVAKEH